MLITLPDTDTVVYILHCDKNNRHKRKTYLILAKYGLACQLLITTVLIIMDDGDGDGDKPSGLHE